MDALMVDRIHFAFTATFHYLFSTADDGSRVAYCGPQDPRDSYAIGAASSASISLSAWSPEFQWNDSLARFGLHGTNPSIRGKRF